MHRLRIYYLGAKMTKNYDQLIYEQRLGEAVANNYMGLSGKFAAIAEAFGEPLIQDSNFEIDYSTALPTINDSYSIPLGVYFDGLKFSCNLQIWITEDDHIVVSHDGKMVYEEDENVLLCYVPEKTWEDKIKELYSHAVKKHQFRSEALKQVKIETNQEKKRNKLKEFRDKWGF